MKERLAVGEIRCVLQEYSVVLLQGLRKVGKTTALLQLKCYYDEAVYIDCRETAYLEKLKDAMTKDNVLILLDEFHYCANCYYLSQELSQKAESSNTFKVVITSSCIQFMNTLAHTSMGGGRSRRVRMPILTFIEYLYFTDRISSYTASLDAVTEDDFINYTKLEPGGGYPLPRIDMDYVNSLVQDKDLAYDNMPVSMLNWRFTTDDVINAFKLLSYKLSDPVTYEKYRIPEVGAKEIAAVDLQNYKSALQQFSVSQASLEIRGLSPQQISHAIYFLLYSDLGVLCGENANKRTTLWNSLRDGMTRSELVDFFEFNLVTVVNPLFFTVLSNELKELLGIKIDFREGKGRILYGSWVETYLRASYARKDAYNVLGSTILKEIDSEGSPHEIDIYDSIRNVMVECKVGNRGLSATHFGYFLQLPQFSQSMCILTSQDIYDSIEREQFTVYRIPYYITAAYFDRLLLPPLRKSRQES